ncbi:transglycosylase family protein [Streptomyces sp. NPDC048506]|uniref:transglycosylase family protein n=1 Tax=Streptomyces sp. NPDC048506 TaxID=3155028 RepID=UPI003422C458
MEFPHESESTARNEFRGYGVRGITAAAVLLAAGALNVATEQPAEAVASGTWDRLAGCESGGNWRIDTGNGFSGGLQLAHSTWRSFGGRAYGGRAAQASRTQQIHVAERVLARQGWGAWPACSARLGLSGSAHRAPHTTRAHHAPQREAHAARERVRHPQLPAKRHKARTLPSVGGAVVVNSGDTLSGISYAHGFRWQEFYRVNRETIGADPDLIFPGMRLAVPHTHRN